ncbi:MarR family winged helix-turn-helix transcriptional regulator [Clostridium algidicarnis]|uniref:MarR family winged helix-turn-helix transcriptional regulator n=1 Tax=Clostridium algidicarnis TaxID=37659 RepID=UPI001C0DC725|nr:MarR family transcriptional regulator [Clostridium algidicarnis]MBU3196594.1 MarR family transcriptional regulator [Clostridium algidicarnis]MBU3209946.1 MarR family transcriptional regulator [Clostridium algidicarnis]MBU3228486.1 MarR family transcriptional regulator [Clostridium algidicarnis]MBU3252229.1 MarR family transcriptional regulator [Clostridium algidicarnis]
MEKKPQGIKIASLIREINLKLNNNISNNFKNSGFTTPQILLIKLLSIEGPLNVSEISEKMFLTKGTVSGIIDRLENQEVVKRNRSNEDKRIVSVALTNKGEDITKTMLGTINKYFDTIFSICKEEDMEKIINGLDILKSVLDENYEEDK